jgi:Na+-driven multidrug efflux pump
MDVAGVALATIISQAVSCILVLSALIRRTDACKLNIRKMSIYKAPLMKILKIGLPAGLQGTLFAISNVIIQSSINSLSMFPNSSKNFSAFFKSQHLFLPNIF